MIQKKLYPGEDLLTVSKKQETSFSLFWFGFWLFTVFYVLAMAEPDFITAANCQVFQILGLAGMIMGGASLMKYKFDDGFLKQMFTLNLLYSVTIVLRGAQYDFNSLKLLFLDVTFGALPYLASVVLLLPRNIANYKKIFQVLLFFGGAYLVGVVVFYDTLHDYDRLNLAAQGLVENLSVLLALPVGYMLISHAYNIGKKDILIIGKKNLFILFMFAVTLFFAIFRARRGMIFMCLTTFMAWGLVAVMSTKKKGLIIAVAVVIALAAAGFVVSMKESSIFGFIQERSDEDTRSGVEEWMFADMSSTDWIIGKGINGKYYCPIVENVNDAEGGGYRDNIETGYLQIILKGGIISLGLLLVTFLPAVYKGLFKSRNALSKAAALWILLWIIYLYPSGGVVFSMNYVLVWIAVGICYSEKIRNLPDSTIKNCLQA